MFLIYFLHSCSDVFENLEPSKLTNSLQSLFYSDYSTQNNEYSKKVNLSLYENAKKVADYLIQNKLSNSDIDFLVKAGNEIPFQSQLVIPYSELIDMLNKNPLIPVDTFKRFFTYQFKGTIFEFDKFISSHKDIVRFSPGELDFVTFTDLYDNYSKYELPVDHEGLTRDESRKKKKRQISKPSKKPTLKT